MAFITGAIFQEIGGLSASPGLLALALPAAFLSTSGRPSSPRLSLWGLCGEARRSPATLCRPAPAPGPPYARR